MKIRLAQVAGSFYSAQADQLKEEINQFLAQAPQLNLKSDQRIKLVIVPHAGYLYSGQVAGAGFKSISTETKRVILLGVSHQSWFSGAAIDESDFWQTPLGKIELDRAWAEKILDQEKQIFLASTPHQAEHSLEVELPFLQVILTEFKIVPILLGQTDNQVLEVLAEKIVQHWDSKTLLVISTDLSHYPNYEIARQVDQKTIKAILSGNPTQLEKTIAQEMAVGYPQLETCACGAEAIKVGLLVGKKLAPGEWRLIQYLNSGDTAGDKGRVVGYAALAYLGPKEKETVLSLDSEAKKQLLIIARQSLTSYLHQKQLPHYQIDQPQLKTKLGVFVTLKKKGQLRGCMGVFSPPTPLWQTVQRQTIAAASQDPRFPPVQAEELNEIEIEISLLSPPEKISDWRQIKLGRQGVIIRQGERSGTFLPQVAQETGWSLEEFLAQLCKHKAGLAPDCYQDPKTEIFIYDAEVFSEKLIANQSAKPPNSPEKFLGPIAVKFKR